MKLLLVCTGLLPSLDLLERLVLRCRRLGPLVAGTAELLRLIGRRRGCRRLGAVRLNHHQARIGQHFAGIDLRRRCRRRRLAFLDMRWNLELALFAARGRLELGLRVARGGRFGWRMRMRCAALG